MKMYTLKSEILEFQIPHTQRADRHKFQRDHYYAIKNLHDLNVPTAVVFHMDLLCVLVHM